MIGSCLVDGQHPNPSEMDGNLSFRPDSLGKVVAVLPARCKLGRHTLGHSQFRAVVQHGEALVSCLECVADGADHSWRLATTSPAPEQAELSEERYFELVLRRSQAALSSTADQRGR